MIRIRLTEWDHEVLKLVSIYIVHCHSSSACINYCWANTDWKSRLKCVCLFQDRRKVCFQRGDACSLPLDIGQFDCVLAANLICRLHTPHAFLDRLSSLVSTGGILVLTTPYTFRTQFTPRVRTVWWTVHSVHYLIQKYMSLPLLLVLLLRPTGCGIKIFP